MKAQILICMGGPSVHRGADGAIFIPAQEDVKEGELSSISSYIMMECYYYSSNFFSFLFPF